MGKKLIEVALPLAEINDASAYDKMPGIGPHPKGIHHWWARLPLPCARAVLFASLVDDPSDDPAFAGKSEEEQEDERQRLFGVMEGLLQKRAHDHPEAFTAAHAEIARCCGKEMPTILDPFCGGGSIPLEAQRLGLESRASDLNPIPVLINKAMLELVPRFSDHAAVNPNARNRTDYHGEWSRARGLAEDVRYYGNLVLEQVREQLGEYYPPVARPQSSGGGLTDVLAWIWARTVKCPNPACGAQMPLISSFVLASKKGRKTWIEPLIDSTSKTISYRVRSGDGTPPTAPKQGRGAKFKCLCCNETPEAQYIKDEGAAGRMACQLIAVVANGVRGKLYLSPTQAHEAAAQVPNASWTPDFEIASDPRNIWCKPYGMSTFTDLFTPRQLLTLSTISSLIREVRKTVDEDAAKTGSTDPAGYAMCVATFLAFALDRCADFGNAMCGWNPSNEKVMHVFGRGAIPMMWDFGEANVLVSTVGGWPTCNAYVAKCIEVIGAGFTTEGLSMQLDAAAAARREKNLVISTDPPYYDNIGYADLSDFFYVWLRHTIGDIYPDVCSTMLVPKKPELIASPYRFDGNAMQAKDHFENGFKEAFSLFRESLDVRFPLTVYYAFKQEESGGDSVVDLTTGWETLLEALLSSGYQITATWPIRASQKWRMNSMGTNALASYIVLACRPRSDDAPLSTRREFRALLRTELSRSLDALEHVNIAPVDLAQTSIGPGMAIFSRYRTVVEADGTSMRVRTALSLINEALAEVLEAQEGELDEDSRWAVAWFEQFGTGEGPYGTAETLCTAKGTAMDGLTRAGIVRAKGGMVNLLRRDELDPKWDPLTDRRLTVWEATQHLIRSIENEGESAAAELLAKLGSFAEQARDLAYRLFNTCERKGWSEEARSYNALVIVWPELTRLAVDVVTNAPPTEVQQEML